MNKRIYKSVEALPRVNVSSTGHYTFYVAIKYKENPHAWSTPYYYNSEEFLGITRPPAYLLKMANKACYNLVIYGKAKFYENDRDGIARYTDLRYHDLDQLVAMLQKDVESND